MFPEPRWHCQFVLWSPTFSFFSVNALYPFFIFSYINTHYLYWRLYTGCVWVTTLVVGSWSLPIHCQSIDVIYGQLSGSLASSLLIGYNPQCQWVRVWHSQIGCPIAGCSTVALFLFSFCPIKRPGSDPPQKVWYEDCCEVWCEKFCCE